MNRPRSAVEPVSVTGPGTSADEPGPAQGRAPEIGSAGSDSEKLASGTGLTIVGRFSGQGLQILIQVFLARLLGPSVFGLYALGWTFFRLGRTVGVLGLDKGAIYFGSLYWKADDGGLRSIFDRTLLFSLVSGGLLAGLLFSGARVLASPAVFDQPGLAPVFRWFAVALPAVIVLQVAAACSRVSQRPQFSVLSEDVLQPAANLVAIVVLAAYGWRLTGALVATTASVYLAAIVSLVLLLRLFPEAYAVKATERVASGQLLGFSFQASLGTVFTVLVLWVDRLMVGLFLPAQDVGIYQVASQISLLFVMILGSFTTIFAPLVVDIHSRADTKRLEELFKVSTKWGLYLTTPPFLLIVFDARGVVGATFGAEYVAGWSVLVILTVGQMVNAGTGSVGQLLVMSGSQRAWLLLSGAMLVLNVGLDLVLIPRMGLMGAAISTAVSVSGLFLAGFWRVRSHLGIIAYDARYWKLGVATTVTVIALWALSRVSFANPLGSVLSHLVTATGVFYGILAALPLDLEERQLVARLSRRWRRSGLPS